MSESERLRINVIPKTQRETRAIEKALRTMIGASAAQASSVLLRTHEKKVPRNGRILDHAESMKEMIAGILRRWFNDLYETEETDKTSKEKRKVIYECKFIDWKKCKTWSE